MFRPKNATVKEYGLTEIEVERLAQGILTEPLDDNKITPQWSGGGLREGDLVTGEVIDLRNDTILVYFGYKSEGLLPFDEGDGFVNTDLDMGDTIKAAIFDIDEEGRIHLTRRNIEEIERRLALLANLAPHQRVSGTVMKVTRAGVVISLEGVNSFIPKTQLGIPLSDIKEGQALDAEVLSCKSADDIILSRLPIVEEEKQAQKEKFIATLQVNDVVEGIVKNVTEFGAFIDIGGLIGLCHISDLSLDKIEHPKDVIKAGQRVRVKVLKFDKEKRRVSLGIKQLMQPSWDQICQKYAVNDKINGKVTSILKYGAFVELEPGVQGLVHVSEMSWSDHVRHPGDILKVGDSVDVIILEVDSEKERLALGLKQVTPDPWALASEKYLPGATIKGTVSNKANFGVFIQLEDGIEGLAHNKEISVDPESLKIGDSVNVSILKVESNLKRISLAI